MSSPWLTFGPKALGALRVGIGVMSAAFASAWAGTTSWHDFIGVVVGVVATFLGFYFPRETPTPT